MSINEKYIIALTKVPNIGIKKAFAICETAKKQNVNLDTNFELFEMIKFCKNEKIINNVAELYISDIDKAIEKSNTIIEDSYKHKINIISFYNELFPKSLRGISSKGKDVSPLLLYYKGNIEKATSLPGIAIIGTREPTTEGVVAGKFYGEEFAKNNFNIISGLALGCDSAGHEGALIGKGMTTAFLAHGLHMIYPSKNKNLAERILNNGGLLISEYPTGEAPQKNYFVERDRLQAGLSKATVVIQTGITGGTMHAVRSTIESNKPLLVVKYSNENIMNNEKVAGNKKLINEGAYSLREIDEAINYISTYNLVFKNNTVPPKIEIKLAEEIITQPNTDKKENAIQAKINFD